MTNTSNRMFTGMRASVAAPTDAEPSTLTNIIGVGWGAVDPNMKIFYNDASGTASFIDLGTNFAVPVTDRTKVYELLMYAPPGAGIVYVQVIDLVTSVASSIYTLNSDLPANTTLLAPAGWVSAGGLLSVAGYGLMSLWIESDY